MMKSIRYPALISCLLLLSACHHIGVRAGFSTGYLGGYYDDHPYYYGSSIITPRPHSHIGRPLPRYKPYHRTFRPYQHNRPGTFRPHRPDRPGAFRPDRHNRPGAFRPDRHNRPGAFRPDRHNRSGGFRPGHRRR